MTQRCNEAMNKYSQALEKKKKQCQQLFDVLQKNRESLEKGGYSLQAFQKMEYQKKINATLLSSALGYAVMIMDKGDYQDSLTILD